MKHRHWLLVGFLLAPLSVLAAESTHDGNHKTTNSADFEQAYQQDTENMHRDMTKNMSSQNPDVAFAQGMIAHHQGAIAMAKTQLRFGKDPELRKLAEAIIKAQQPEIEQMQKWLKQHPGQ
ncbi:MULTISPECIES: CopM family metallochaperone [Lonsdalea]|uniref:DUF305 domain-containing protein n=2 Tax=Lonsdalea TaxID=1082702 RepID=A0ACD1JBB9_9GAMM|nr:MULTISPECIES: DUF305 domain-containing protein [Lonsdalea]OSM95797.1 DUF305 domain-containing protein [Lonsdalea populi]OSM96665.1 DUF305 domain-containing protein [Lonsdalea populi]QPQ25927.1 DUF305 domain-containing protein [Lonsdalea populi]RAT12444.1 DUF305 domain-containing protein [Lonsdalea quercina]RAT14167.1 DUF305 domain-containing protein [Lonsdalea quercina]